MFFVKSNDGTRIAVYDPNPKGRCPVLLIHGWPLSHKIFEYQVDTLLEGGYRVITLDLRGFGNSDAPMCSYSYDQMSRDLFCVVLCLGLRRFILGGFSMGGAIALRYMKNFRGLGVMKLMLMAAAAPSFTQRVDFPYGVPKKDVNQFICEVSADRPAFARKFSHEMLFASPHSDAALDWFEDIALSATGIGTVQAAISLRDEDGRKDIGCVHVPTAVFQGAHDKVVPNDLTMLQYKNIPGARLYNFEHSGHGMIYDEVEQFNQCMLEFIQS